MPMNRQRWLPSNDFTDSRLSRLPPAVRLTAAGLRLIVDDNGRGEVRPRQILADIWEYEEEMTTADVEQHLMMLDDAQFLRLYTADGLSLFQIRVWPAVQHGRDHRFPPPPGFMKPSRTSQETFMAVERGRERERESGSVGARGIPPAWHVNPQSRDTTPENEQLPDLDDTTDEVLPSVFCSEHQPYGTEDKCGPCGTAREGAKVWREGRARRVLAARRTRKPVRFEEQLDLGDDQAEWGETF